MIEREHRMTGKEWSNELGGPRCPGIARARDENDGHAFAAQLIRDALPAGFAAGVTDYLTKPFYPAYVRSRVREWLLRKRVETPEKA